MVCISEIAREAHRQSICLDEPKNIKFVDEWITCLIDNQAKKIANKQSFVNNIGRKFPTFQLRKFMNFQGNVQKYLDSVETTFKENQVYSFLKDVLYTGIHLYISTLYHTTLLSSLEDFVYKFLVSVFKGTNKKYVHLQKQFENKLMNNFSDM